MADMSSRSRIAGCALLIILATAALSAFQSQPTQSVGQPSITVTELPPEAIPAGTCKESYSGYLEVTEYSKPKKTNFTTKQIGNYVNKRLSEGYSLSLYPQASGRLFVIESCHSVKR